MIVCCTTVFVCFLFQLELALLTSGQSCNSAPNVLKAEASEPERESYPLNTTVTFSCDYGFVPNGGKLTTTCIVGARSSEAQWTPINATCIPRSCGDPGYVLNAERHGSLFLFPNSVVYVCYEGYVMSGLSQRFCQTNGQWSGTLPTCERISCQPPKSPEHGNVKYESLTYGSELVYECDRGYILDNKETRKCSSSGQWSGNEPLCIESNCPLPDAPKYGTVELVGGQRRIGSIILYQCDSDRILHGSGTAKCLNNGEWTFPPPDCLEPCHIPKVDNGKIGKMEKYRRYWETFVEISVGTRIDNNEEVILQCNSGTFVKVDNVEVEQAKISCLGGQWSTNPVCNSASCTDPPPSVPNATLMTKEREHGTSLTYNCNTYFLKVKYGNTKCQLGKWVGTLPICNDTRCYIDDLKEYNVSSDGPSMKITGSYFYPKCKEGFVLSKEGIKIQCLGGVWKTDGQICKPANCLGNPPMQANVKIESFSGQHNTIAAYSCKSGYNLKDNSFEIRCLYGKWGGKLPECIDSQCYERNLHTKRGIDVSSNFPTASDTRGNLQCVNGYVLDKLHLPICRDGKWEESSVSPCEPKPCKIDIIDHGKMQYAHGEPEQYYDLKVGKFHGNGSGFYVYCFEPYISHSGLKRAKVYCNKGNWIPSAICSLPEESHDGNSEIIVALSKSTPSIEHKGSKDELESTSSSAVHEVDTENLLTSEQSMADDLKSRLTTKDLLLEGTENPLSQPTPMSSLKTHYKEISGTVESNRKASNRSACNCTYSLYDSTVVAYTEKEEIVSYGSQVKHGCKIHFRCLNVGQQHLIGISEILCNEDCRWHSSMFPTCTEPRNGDVALRIDAITGKVLTISPSGIIYVPSNFELYVDCYIINVNEWPLLQGPVSLKPVEFDSPKVTSIHIKKMNSIYNSKYNCGSQYGRSNSIEIKVKECPKITKTDNSVSISYSDGQNVGSLAEFRCVDQFSVLLGLKLILCLSSLKWSGEPPSCQYIECQGFMDTGTSLSVSYEPNQRVGSIAKFQCDPFHTRKGFEFAKCLSNGTWSHEIPTCVAPTCSIESLVEALPEEVVPVETDIAGEIMPFKSEIKLTCAEERLKPVDLRTASCGEQGKWIVGGDVECVAACNPIENLEKLGVVIIPEKELYRFGEQLIFSCQPGQTLNSSIERIMCLKDGWSESEFPSCITF